MRPPSFLARRPAPARTSPALSALLGDPDAVAGGTCGHDFGQRGRDVGFEGGVETMLFRIEDTVAMDDPAEVPGAEIYPEAGISAGRNHPRSSSAGGGGAPAARAGRAVRRAPMPGGGAAGETDSREPRQRPRRPAVHTSLLRAAPGRAQC